MLEVGLTIVVQVGGYNLSRRRKILGAKASIRSGIPRLLVFFRQTIFSVAKNIVYLKIVTNQRQSICPRLPRTRNSCETVCVHWTRAAPAVNSEIFGRRPPSCLKIPTKSAIAGMLHFLLYLYCSSRVVC